MPMIRPFGTDPTLAEWQGFVDDTPALITRAAWQCVLTRLSQGLFLLEIPIWMDDGEVLVQLNFSGNSENFPIVAKITYLPVNTPKEGQVTIETFTNFVEIIGLTNLNNPALYGGGGTLAGTEFHASLAGVASSPYNFVLEHPANAADLVNVINTTLGATAPFAPFSTYATAATAMVNGVEVLTITLNNPPNPATALTLTDGLGGALAILGITPGTYAPGAPADPSELWNLKVIQCSDFVSSIEGPYYP
jgi:hypothetical protein